MIKMKIPKINLEKNKSAVLAFRLGLNERLKYQKRWGHCGVSKVCRELLSWYYENEKAASR